MQEGFVVKFLDQGLQLPAQLRIGDLLERLAQLPLAAAQGSRTELFAKLCGQTVQQFPGPGWRAFDGRPVAILDGPGGVGDPAFFAALGQDAEVQFVALLFRHEGIVTETEIVFVALKVTDCMGAVSTSDTVAVSYACTGRE